MFSRFRTAKEKKEILEGLRDGTVDIVIGTHGLVGNSVQFKDLGSLIIDRGAALWHCGQREAEAVA